MPNGSGSLWLLDVHQQLPLREQQIHPPIDSRTVSIGADDPILGEQSNTFYDAIEGHRCRWGQVGDTNFMTNFKQGW